MTNRFTVGQLYPNYVQKTPFKPVKQHSEHRSDSTVTSFENVLQNQITFSRHAEARLQQRGIQLKPEQIKKMGEALTKAEKKGAQDSLMVMNGMAFIVNVKNKTVVTAMDQHHMKDHVFTQIDSAVIIS